ncbi:O-antigen ligase family protein [Aestuariibaculum lutulentum]|uniref:O-antigen ligase family protein n=2 Tax=Aestuariibaculum lutulentum TaxID=2920935 RepID=A0ABS9RGN3_9FLAO|nr:O-antigen ligase family protein [Aestuariibaculum lutulentum]MCH4552104.1 O-antigen ligase family protein [Aestuariibaculum lutulentum]
MECDKQDKYNLILKFLFFLVGFSIPFSYAFNSIAIGLLFLFSFKFFSLDKYKNDIIIKIGYLPLLFFVVFLLQVLGVFYSQDINKGLSYAIQNIVFVLFPIIFFNLSTYLTKDKIRLAVYGLIFGVSAILISIYINIFIEIFKKNLEFNTLLTRFTRVGFVKYGIEEIHPPYLGILTIFSLVVLLHVKLIKRKSLDYILRGFLFLFLGCSLYGISSIMSVIVLFIFLITSIIFLSKSIKFRILTTLSFFGIFIIILINLNSIRIVTKDFPGNSLLGRIQWSIFKGKGDTSRPENWKSVTNVIKDNLFFGVGSDGGLKDLQSFRDPKSESFKFKHNAHNQYLEFFLRHGIVGFIIYLFMLYELIRVAFYSRNEVFIWFLITFLISSMTESYLVRQIGLTFFTFYSILFYTYYKPKINEF